MGLGVSFNDIIIFCILHQLTNELILLFRKLADGMFLDSCKKVAKLYPKIQFEAMIVDNTCMQVRVCMQYIQSFIP